MAKDIKVIERVQEKFVRNVQGLRASTYPDRLKELDILSLENRRVYLDLVEVFKIIYGFNNVTRSDYFTLNCDIDWRPTRGNDCPLNIVTQRCNLDIRRYFFTVRVASPWNGLPNHIKLMTKLTPFKIALKSHLKDFA